MANIIPRGIQHTIGTTFDVYVSTANPESGDTLQFIVSENEKSTPIINKIYDFTTNRIQLILSESDLEKLTLGNYIYKLVYQKSGIIKCVKSGDFDVIWGCGCNG